MSRNENRESDPNYELNYAIRLTFGLVHSVILTLITFGLIVWFPSLSGWSFALLGCLVLPFISSLLSVLCTGCVQYVCDGSVNTTTILKSFWIPPVGIFCISLFILPLEILPSKGIGPLNTLIATSVVMNAVITGILQVYSVLPQSNSIESEPQPEAKPEAQPEVQPEAQPEAQLEVQPEAKPEAQPEAKPEAHSSLDSDTATGSDISSPT